MEAQASQAVPDDSQGRVPLNRAYSRTSSFDSDSSDQQSFLRRTNSRRSYEGTTSYWERAKALQQLAMDKFFQLTFPQRALACALGVAGFVLGILFLIYHQPILTTMENWARHWRSVKGGWILLWFAVFITAFPPLFGYSYFLTTTGFIYGFPNGWFVSATASIAGSACSFVVSRRLLASYVQRIARKDDRFELFSKVAHDGDFKLLCLIRLCPLPYSLSNGALATLTKISLRSFTLATAVITPKLLIHTFVGAQMAAIGDGGASSRSTTIHYLSIAFAMIVGLFTAHYVYNKAQAVAASSRMDEPELGDQVEAQLPSQYLDDADDYVRPQTNLRRGSSSNGVAR